MTEAQLAVRSSKARDLAREMARATGLPIERVVEEALEAYAAKMAPRGVGEAWDRLLAIAAEDRPEGATSDTRDLYDEQGMPV